MCGVIFTMTSKPSTYNARDVDKLLTQGLITGVVRGYDSTGVASIGVSKKYQGIDRWFRMRKNTKPGPFFAASEEWNKDVMPSIDFADVVMVHHRAATHGIVNDRNAHPFLVNTKDDNKVKVIGMHNGGIHNWRKFKPPKHIDVDSEAIIHTLAHTDNHIEVLEELSGAYVLVWWDFIKNSLFIAKNDSRPLAVTWLPQYDRFIAASERGMLDWLIKRNKFVDHNAEKVKIEEHTLYQIKVGEAEPDKWLKTEYTPKFGGYNTGYYGTYYGQGSVASPQPPVSMKFNATKVTARFLEWSPYSHMNNNNRGKLWGTTNTPIAIPVVIYSVDAKVADEIEKAGYFTFDLDALRTQVFGELPITFKGQEPCVIDGWSNSLAAVPVEEVRLEGAKYLWTKILDRINEHNPFWDKVRYQLFGSYNKIQVKKERKAMDDCTIETFQNDDNLDRYFDQVVNKTKTNLPTITTESRRISKSDEDLVDGPGNTKIPYASWLKYTRVGCAYCTHAFHVDPDQENVVWLSGDSAPAPMHEKCFKDFSKETSSAEAF